MGKQHLEPASTIRLWDNTKGFGKAKELRGALRRNSRATYIVFVASERCSKLVHACRDCMEIWVINKVEKRGDQTPRIGGAVSSLLGGEAYMTKPEV